LLEGSASIRTVPLGRFNERMGREKPSQFGLIACRKARSDQFALHWIQEIHRRTFLVDVSLDPNVVSLRPIAIVPATPSTLDGLCGPEQRNGVGSSFEVEDRRSATVDCYVWLVVPLHRRNSREDLRQRRFSVLNFLRVRLRVQQRSEALTFLRVSLRFSCTVLRALLRSSSAYVPSARQAGPHAHPI
jgi:hypothetical protein